MSQHSQNLYVIQILCILALIVACPVTGTGIASASILTFESNFVAATYGDRVTSTNMNGQSYVVGGEGFTPNIVCDFSLPNGRPSTWTSGYGDLRSVLYEGNTSLPLQLTFTADAGFKVRLYYFDLAAYQAQPVSPVINSVTVTNGQGQLLYSLIRPTISKTTHTSFQFFATPLESSKLILRIDATNLTQGFRSEDIGLDNVVFGQTVPEPTSSTMLLVALGIANSLRLSRARVFG